MLQHRDEDRRRAPASARLRSTGDVATAAAALQLPGAVAAFVAISLYTASQSALGRLLPAGESPVFVWFRDHSTILVWLVLAWLLALGVLRHGARWPWRAACARDWLALAELAAIAAVAVAVTRAWSGLLGVAHGVLQASILLQVPADRSGGCGAVPLARDARRRLAAGHAMAVSRARDVPRDEGGRLAVQRDGHGGRQLRPGGGPDRPRGPGPARSVPADEVLGWAREAIEDVAPGERFFVYAHLLDVHNDLWKKADGLDVGETPRDLYDNNLSYLDRAMARFLGWLRARGHYERTVILLTSDHGEQFWEHGASLHGHTLYEEELRVPLILLAHTVRGRVDDVPVVVADAVPTLLELAGYAARPPFDDPRMGISLVPLLTGAERDRYLRRDVVGRASFKRTYVLYRDWRWKLVWSAEFDLVQLFDVAADAGERRNVVQERPDLAAELERELLGYLARVGGLAYRPLLTH